MTVALSTDALSTDALSTDALSTDALSTDEGKARFSNATALIRRPADTFLPAFLVAGFARIRFFVLRLNSCESSYW